MHDSNQLTCRRALKAILVAALVAGVVLPGSAALAQPPGGVLAEAEDPAVLAIREMNPRTPEDLMFAIKVLINLRRHDEAKKYLAKLAALNTDEQALHQLQKKYGSGIFVRMANDPKMAPEGKKFADRVLAAAHKAVRDPARVAALIGKLSDPAAHVRAAAIEDLKEAGAAAVAPLLAALADSRREKEHPAIRNALVALGPAVIEPLVGALEARDTKLRAQVIQVLGRLNVRPALKYLVRPYLDPKSPPELKKAAADAMARMTGYTPKPREGELYLLGRVKAYSAGTLPRRPDAEGFVTLWRWDEDRRQSTPRKFLATDGSLVIAARLAADLYYLWPQKTEYRRYYLAALLESAKLVGGLDNPLDRDPRGARSEAAQLGADALVDLLDYAMREDRIPAAIGAVEVLADIGDADLLATTGGRPSTLMRALRHGNRRLRFAALSTIMKLDPKSPYVGSSYVPETLAYFATGGGERRALVGHARLERAQTIAGMLRELGYQTKVAITGKRLVQEARAATDLELIFLSDSIYSPQTDAVLQSLRRDVRTAKLPIGLVVRPENLEPARRRFRDDPLTIVLPFPLKREFLAFHARRLLGSVGRELVTAEERQRHALAALKWLEQLAADRETYSYYDITRLGPKLIETLHTDRLAVAAAPLLGKIGSPAVQRALVDTASQNARPLPVRQAAAAAFTTAVAERGLLLSREEILRQYECYNQSELLDRSTQKLLASILDTIEARRRAEAEEKQRLLGKSGGNQ